MNRPEYMDEYFLNLPPDDDPLRCCICQGVMKDAVMCSNQHCFCENCLTRALEFKKECPTCQVAVVAPQPARPIRSIISRMEVFCKHRAEGCKITAHLERIEAHEASCEYAYTTCPHSKCQVRLMNKDLAAHLLQCRHASSKCPGCGIDVKQADMASHSCFSMAIKTVGDLRAEIVSMREEYGRTLTRLQQELQEERTHRKAMEDRLRAVESGGSRPRPPMQPQPKPLDSRPSTGWVVRLTGDQARGCLPVNEVGWIAKDEHDHQPFQVWTWKKKSYWFRESEVKGVCRPGDIVSGSNAHPGLPCIRGPDWRWGDQDQNSFGFIADVQTSGWCNIQWESGRTGRYRVGAQNSYDLIVADMTRFNYGPVSSM